MLRKVGTEANDRAVQTCALANGAQAIGALAAGALAIGALALGALAIGRMAGPESRASKSMSS
jgi:hypothetical protein